MSREEFIAKCEEYAKLERGIYNHYGITEEPHIPKIIEWAKTTERFSEDIGRELIALTVEKSAVQTDMLHLYLEHAAEFYNLPHTTTLPSLNVGGRIDLLYPLLFFGAREVITVDPLNEARTEETEFDFGYGKEKVKIEYVKSMIEVYEPDRDYGSIMDLNIEREGRPRVFDIARDNLVRDGYLLHSPMATEDDTFDTTGLEATDAVGKHIVVYRKLQHQRSNNITHVACFISNLLVR